MSYKSLDGNSSGKNGNKAFALETQEVRSKSSSRMSSITALQDDSHSSWLSEPLTDGGHAAAAHFDATDPYYVFRDDLDRKLDLMDEGLAEYIRVVHQTDTAVNTYELKEVKKQLKRHIKNAESTLKDVQMTVQLIEGDREKFNHISDDELYERTALVHTSKDRLNRAKQELTSEAVKAKMLADERAKAIRRAGADSLGARTDAERENTNFIVDSQARTSLLMQHQDETLDELDVAVSRVGAMADNIHEEIGQQNKILTEIEEDLENVEEQMGVVMGKLAKLLHTKDRWQLCTIASLFLTVIVLLLLIIYT